MDGKPRGLFSHIADLLYLFKDESDRDLISCDGVAAAAEFRDQNRPSQSKTLPSTPRPLSSFDKERDNCSDLASH